MLRHFRPAIVLTLAFTVLCGLAYPLGVTGLAQALFPGEANGSLIVKNGTVVGSALIGQSFTADTYFHGRPSATTDTDPADAAKTVPAPYNAANSSGSNLGPTSQALIDRVKTDIATLQKEHPGPVPADLVTTSASGLDPDISPAAAEFQVARVARVRHIPEDRLRALVATYTKGRLAGVIGEPTVNVLQLNLARDELASK